MSHEFMGMTEDAVAHSNLPYTSVSALYLAKEAETGWVVTREFHGLPLYASIITTRGAVLWNHMVTSAIRFTRKEDAEKLLALCSFWPTSKAVGL
jgi:hypothetical protein